MSTRNLCRKTLTLICAILLALTPVMGALAETDTESATQYVTREQAVSEFVQSVGRNNLYGTDFILSEFEDTEEIDPEYLSDFAKATTNGILRREWDLELRPKDSVTRLEALLMLYFTITTKGEAPEATQEPIAYTDIPETAKSYIDALSAAGYMQQYPSGELGVNSFITAEELKDLTNLSDATFRTVSFRDSFYGYVNEKAFRNANLNNPSYIDALHGAVVLSDDSWSYFADISNHITDTEMALLTQLMSGEMAYEEGTPEQRVYDMLMCINAPEAASDEDMKAYSDYRGRILSAESIGELINATNEIYAETGIATLFSVIAGNEPKTNMDYPQIGMVKAGVGDILSYYSAMQDANGPVYYEKLTKYAETCGIKIDAEGIERAVALQALAGSGENAMMSFANGLSLKKMMMPELDLNELLAPILAEHPEVDPETLEIKESSVALHTKEEADADFTSVKLTGVIDALGFSGYEQVLFGSDEAMSEIDKMLSDEKNLPALKLNACLALSQATSTYLSDEESDVVDSFSKILLSIVMLEPYAEEDIDSMADTFSFAGLDDGNKDVLSPSNITTLNGLLPNDVALIYCKNEYDDQISEEVSKMLHDIWMAYIVRFTDNEWMSDATKIGAIKKIINMLAVIGYADNEEHPEIIPIENGGTVFKNTINVAKNKLNVQVRSCLEEGYDRTMTYTSPDTVNACYIPSTNSMNIYAGILAWPLYDVNGTYAQNLGAVGMVVAHEIGHAFDNIGAQFDENGVARDWWTEEDYAVFKELQEKFVEYYKRFDVVDGVVQDSEVTITENMADFAGLTCVMDVIGDDKQAQMEALESYARMWARIGTEKLLTGAQSLTDVHSSNVVRVNACVASLDAFYDIYGVEEGDPMYVAPEDRLKLW